MGQVQPVQFGAQSYEASSKGATIERCINFYAEKNPEGASSPVTLYGTPGLVLFASVGDGPIRGMGFFKQRIYVVSGNNLYKVTRTGSSSLVGNINGSGAVYIISNSTHVVICGNQEAYYYDGADLNQLPQGSFNGATYQDGYGIYTEIGTEKFWISGVDDLTTISALDFSTADTFPDNVVGVLSNYRELWVFGERTIEIYQNTGNASFPFQRAFFIEQGCLSGRSAAKSDRKVFWLGDDFAVYQAEGYTPTRISTHAIERKIAEAGGRSSASGFIYDQLGHTFYVLSFSDLTVCYDLTTGVWHERVSSEISRWRPNTFIRAFNKNIVGDYETGSLYELSESTYTDNSETITRTVVSPPVHNNGSRFFMPEFFVDFEAGQGLNSGNGSSPVALLSYSDDNGETWSSDIEADVGAIGDYGARAVWNRLGMSRKRHMRIRISEPIKTSITGAYARIVPGLS